MIPKFVEILVVQTHNYLDLRGTDMATNNFNNIVVHYEDGTQQEDNVNSVTAREQNRFEGWECWAGVQQISIANTGDVYRAICKVGGKLGNIYEGSFTMPEDTIICNKPDCICAADVAISKAHPDHVHKLRVGK